MRSKAERQAALVRILENRALASQREIVALLRAQGIAATQASISRDLRELGLIKINGHYTRDAGPGIDAAVYSGRLHPELIKSVDPVGANLVVVHTPAGSAQPVAVALDRLNLPDIAGTVAGDDTVFVAVRSRSAQGRVMALLKGAAVRPARAGQRA